MLCHLFIGPGPCNFEIHKYRLFLESVCVGKQEIGLISDPSTKGHEIPLSSSIYTALRAPFRLWVLFRFKVRRLLRRDVSHIRSQIVIEAGCPDLSMR